MPARKSYIDIAKGIGIILVVLGHLDANSDMSRNLIYSFHMPLFFFLSGLFVKTDIPFADYLKKYAKTVYLPFAFFVLFDIVLTTVLDLCSGKNAFLNFGNKLLTFTGLKLGVMNIALWFLFGLFLIHLVFYFVNKNRRVKISALLLTVLFVFMRTKLTLPHYCLYVVAIPCFGFYIFGNLLKTSVFSLAEKVSKQKTIFTVLSLAIFVLIFYTSNQTTCIDTTIYRYGNPFLYYVNAVLGILGTLMISVILSDFAKADKFLGFYGRNSIYILVTHYYICRPLVRTIMAKAGLWAYVYSPGMQVGMLILMLLLSIPWIFFAERYLGFIFGKNK